MRAATRPGEQKAGHAIVVALVLVAAALAGCTHAEDDLGDEWRSPGRTGTGGNGGGGGGGDPPDVPDVPIDPDEPPTNETEPPALRIALSVTASARSGWADEDNFTFDATNSTIENGNATRWIFQFGDGNETVLENTTEPKAFHTYDAGGVYTVNITVEAAGGAGGNETGNQTRNLTVAVHERFQFLGSLQAALVPGSSTSRDEFFAVQPGAASFVLAAEIESTAVVGDTEGTVGVLDPDGEVRDEGAYGPLAPGENTTVTLSGELDPALAGDHIVHLEVTGRMRYDVAIEVWYQEPPAG